MTENLDEHIRNEVVLTGLLRYIKENIDTIREPDALIEDIQAAIWTINVINQYIKDHFDYDEWWEAYLDSLPEPYFKKELNKDE